MSGFILGEDRFQATLFPKCLDDYVAEDSAVRVIDVFIDGLNLPGMGFKTQPNETGRPAYHPGQDEETFSRSGRYDRIWPNSVDIGNHSSF